ncbi:MAG: TetR/AcrR family transcriptional regulator [Planctomycetota bacterium]
MVTSPKATQPRPHATCQDRSRRTLERILVAAEALLQERNFDELTMVDLAKRAGCAVGTLYARIPSKDSLLTCLYERGQELARDVPAAVFEQHRNAALEERAQVVCRMIIQRCEANRGIIRATTEHLFRHPHEDAHGFRRQVTATMKSIAAFLAEKADRIPRAERQKACEFALLAAFEVAQGRVVYGDRSGWRLRYSRKELEQRITLLMLSYLQACTS